MRGGKYRHAIFCVVYSLGNKGIEYLILRRKHHWTGWEFVKGKIERFETKRIAARRETKEETGLKILHMKRFHVSGRYLYKNELKDRPGITGQTYTLFAAEVKKGKARIDRKEHSGYKWANFKEAMKMLTWADQRKCLSIADKWIRSQMINCTLCK